MRKQSNPDPFSAARKRMVREQLSEFPSRVVEAMSRVPRQEFIPEVHQSLAYADRAVPIGFNQTISQPYVVALMTTQLNPQPTDRILEIGTGSGYQAAVLAQLVAEVYSVEIIEPLADRAQATLARLGSRNVHLRLGDGSAGWPEAAPFDGVIVTCAPESVPTPLIQQLRDGGYLLIPIGPAGEQELFVFQKYNGGLAGLAHSPVMFVPMTGAAQRESRGDGQFLA